MRRKVILPKSGMGIEEGIISRWLKAVGDEIHAGESLVEIENAKAIETIEAPVAGKLVAILAGDGQTVPVNSTIAEIEEGQG